MTTLLDFQLRALKYPAGGVDLESQEALRKLVVWLENLKIREYTIEDRKLLTDIQSINWNVAFERYLRDLGCPVHPSQTKAAVEWLVAFAVNLDYEDNAAKLARLDEAGPAARASEAAAAAAGAAASAEAAGAAASVPAGRPSAAVQHGGEEGTFVDLQAATPEVVEALRRLVAAAGVELQAHGTPGSGDDGGELMVGLKAAAERLLYSVGPAMGGGPGAVGAALEGLPLGFEVEGEALASAARALRLLFVADLRRLQSQIDHAVVEMQEYTANPRTDASLGKVGR